MKYFKMMLFLVITVILGIFFHAYALGNKHAHEINANATSLRMKGEAHRLVASHNIAVCEMTKLIDEMNPLYQKGYIMGVRGINKPLGNILIIYTEGHYEDILKIAMNDSISTML